MCKFASGIMKYKMSGIWWDMDIDHHSDLIEKFGIKDDKTPASFVKFEMTPIDGDPFNHKRENWRLEADQDQIPAWWDRERAEEMFWPNLQKLFAERFLVKNNGYTIQSGRWFTKESKISLQGGTITDMRGGTITDMRGGTIASMRNGTIASMKGGTITDMRGGTIASMRGGTIASMWGGTITDMWGGTIASMRGGTIASMRGGTITDMRGGTITDMWGGTITNMWGGTITHMRGGVVLEQTGDSIIVKGNEIYVANGDFKIKYVGPK